MCLTKYLMNIGSQVSSTVMDPSREDFHSPLLCPPDVQAIGENGHAYVITVAKTHVTFKNDVNPRDKKNQTRAPLALAKVRASGANNAATFVRYTCSQ